MVSVSMRRDRVPQIKYKDSGRIVFSEVNIVQMTFGNLARMGVHVCLYFIPLIKSEVSEK